MATRTYFHIRGASQRTQEAERLLARYPRLDEADLARLVETFPAVPLIDKAVMSADAHLSDKLAAFCHDHGSRLNTPVAALSLSLLLPLVGALAALWWFLG
ncbi:hypothetical protein [Sphingopyxis panaciterrulae]|jgi:hypothetical protein|uniref:Uncharacterized protein n=1 Tax=Sphingopyxis panaciterrulae TaxID=462372 RepID=A0A7W9B6Q1_9SPHN|nr:hypothetical protein [Sphingopyxis panaciterrulae]MBB5707016.1 hypothetical protein [Sphingopyxis panaciterrulae]